MTKTLKLGSLMLAGLECHSDAFEAEEPEDMIPATFEGSRMTFAAEDREALWSYLNDAANSADASYLEGKDPLDAKMSKSLANLASKVLRSISG
jgi:hypothetical protein